MKLKHFEINNEGLIKRSIFDVYRENPLDGQSLATQKRGTFVSSSNSPSNNGNFFKSGNTIRLSFLGSKLIRLLNRLKQKRCYYLLPSNIYITKTNTFN